MLNIEGHSGKGTQLEDGNDAAVNLISKVFFMKLLRDEPRSEFDLGSLTGYSVM
jgi:hypothetical protein